jgi:multiple sugar transport system ATP-binding protein
MNFLPAHLAHHRLTLPMVEFDLPPALWNRLRGYHGQLLIGIRPEHLQTVTSPGKNKELGPFFEATVDIIEWMGADVYAHLAIPEKIFLSSDACYGRDLNIKSEHLIARLNSDNPVKVGEKLTMQLDIHKLHLFDSRTGENLNLTD